MPLSAYSHQRRDKKVLNNKGRSFVEKVTQAVREADQAFTTTGGSTRRWVRDCFLPALEKRGLAIREPEPPQEDLLVHAEEGNDGKE